MEKQIIEGDNPVDEKICIFENFPSTTGHEKSCGNSGGPPPKAKYSLVTDSEQVPWGKGEKNPYKGSEIATETLCLQAVEPSI